ncbi:MAG: DUF2975 domain-containing protein [Oscillospiraceae bacterium]|nr:DUF2975 domain-containing protein [Oscillospiraceae bacterium]
MKTNITILLIRVFLVFVFFVGILICAWWYPFSLTITTGFFVPDLEENDISFNMYTEFYSQLAFYWSVSIPCFVVVMLGFRGTVIAKKEGAFSIRSAKTLFKMALILFIASVVFLIGNVIFMMLKWNVFAILYFIVGGMGLVISGVLYAGHKYLVNASQLKEENDSIL